MRLLILAGLLSCAAAQAQAQQVMDGSGSELGPGFAKQFALKMVGKTPDPFSAQLLNVRKSPSDPSDICGLVNLKTQSGGYAGFQPFMIYGGELYLPQECR